MQILGDVLDFAIVGGPRCATSSLYSALRAHPDICMPSMKEPHFFATDLPGCRILKDPDAYATLFRKTSAGQLCGEASTMYLYSGSAVAEMLKIWPRLKVIAVVRNPIELFQSYHNHLLSSLDETEQNSETAWRLQAERASGRRIPTSCREPRLLEYAAICSQGNQGIGSWISFLPDSVWFFRLMN